MYHVLCWSYEFLTCKKRSHQNPSRIYDWETFLKGLIYPSWSLSFGILLFLHACSLSCLEGNPPPPPKLRKTCKNSHQTRCLTTYPNLNHSRSMPDLNHLVRVSQLTGYLLDTTLALCGVLRGHLNGTEPSLIL